MTEIESKQEYARARNAVTLARESRTGLTAAKAVLRQVSAKCLVNRCSAMISQHIPTCDGYCGLESA